MTALAPTLEAFFTSRLINEKGVSPHTIAAYRDTFRLLLSFAHEHNGKQPAALELEDLDAPVIAAFLDHLEHQRGNSPRTRNARLAAIHSMFRYAALRHPEHAALISRVIALPAKRFDRAIVTYLTPDEVNALLAAPDRARWIGRRPHAAHGGDPERAARHRAHQPAQPRRAASDWRPHPGHRQGPQTESDAADQPDRRRAPPMAQRTSRTA
jgi:site-specific recombinase XerD